MFWYYTESFDVSINQSSSTGITTNQLHGQRRSLANELNIYIHNLSGASSKLMSINHCLATSSYDLILFQETWFSGTTDTSLLLANLSYLIYRCDRSQFTSDNKRGGGVAILYRNHLDIRIVELPKTRLEIQCICLNNVYIFNVYAPPHHRHRNIFVNEFYDCVKFVLDGKGSQNVMIFGDFNSPTIKWEFDDE